MKTLQEWYDKQHRFSEYVAAGDEIDSDMYYHFLEALPPKAMTHYGFLLGEPLTHNAKNEPVYDSFYQSPDGKRFYAGGPKTLRQFLDSRSEAYTLTTA